MVILHPQPPMIGLTFDEVSGSLGHMGSLGPMGSQNTNFQNSPNPCLWVESKFSKRGSRKNSVVQYLKPGVSRLL